MEESKKILPDNEIDLAKLIRITWLKKWFIAKVAGIFIFLGLIIAFTTPEEYYASSTLIPESTDADNKLGGSLGGLATLAGVNLGGLTGGNTGINPGLYRSIVQSTPFLVELMHSKYFFKELNKEVTLYEYTLNHQKKSLVSKVTALPFQILDWVNSLRKSAKLPSQEMTDNSILSLSEDELKVAIYLDSKLTVLMDWELNVVTIDTKMQDPIVAAKMNKFVADYITGFVTNYMISKSTKQLDFVENQYSEKKIEFEQSQFRLAKFRDENKNINTSRAKSEEERLQAEYNLLFNVYNQLNQQREQIMLEVKKDTPVFTVLEPAVVPNYPESPKKKIIVLLFLVVGTAFGSIWILFRHRSSYINSVE